MGLIFWLSSSPQGVTPYLRPPLDKLAHMGGFGVLAVLLRFATGRVWLGVLLASLYGVSDEVHQARVPGRDADFLDWSADTGGALAAALLTRQRRERAKPLE